MDYDRGGECSGHQLKHAVKLSWLPLLWHADIVPATEAHRKAVGFRLLEEREILGSRAKTHARTIGVSTKRNFVG